MLIHDTLSGWKSNEILFDSDLPFYGSTFVLKFDVMSAVNLHTAMTFDITESFTLFQYKSVNLPTNFTIKLGATLTVISSNQGIQSGNLVFDLLKDDLGIDSYAFPITIDSGTYSSGNMFNSSPSGNYYRTDRINTIGLKQILSPQTIILKVLHSNILNQRSK
jgi:hypothetical protein